MNVVQMPAKYLTMILTCFLFAIPAEAQVVAGVEFTTYEVSLGVGEMVQYVGQAYDSGGNPVTSGVTYTYVTNQPTLLEIGSTTGLAIALSKATPSDGLLVIVRAEYDGGLIMRIASFQEGELSWADTINDGTVGQPYLAQLCGYIVDADGYIVSQSRPPPDCPLVFAQRPAPPAFSTKGQRPQPFPCSQAFPESGPTSFCSAVQVKIRK